jgi:hypothetical protein
MENNIFKYSPKELSTDAFIKYFFLWCQENNQTDKLRTLLLGKNERISNNISILGVETQVQIKKKKADLIISIELDGVLKKILFENKTYSTTSQYQLENYKQKLDVSIFKFLKLGYINRGEKEICKITNYDVIDSKMFYETICAVSKTQTNLIIEQYKSYLHDSYVVLIDRFQHAYISGNIVKELSRSDAQIYLAEKIAESLGEFELDKVNLALDKDLYHIQQGSSSGRPWTEIVFIEEGHYPEAIFWRIDIRANKYYIRLNQYSVSKDKTENFKSQKKDRLQAYRSFAKHYFDEFKSIKQGRLSNKGENEKEIIIFFIEENNFFELIEKIQLFTKEFKKSYLELNKLLLK